jgi:hypothetical protein
MRFRILAPLVLLLLVSAARSANAQPPCADHPCTAHLVATEHVRRWTAKGSPGEAWLLYLNIYESKKRLAYHVLPGGCDASYANANVSASLHACGHRSQLDYVAWAGHKRLRVEYRYVKR